MGNIQVNRVTNANVYLNGGNLLGRASEVTLPVIKQLFADHKALGLANALEIPTGGIDKMEAKFKWNSFYEEALSPLLNRTKSVQLQVRAVQEEYTGQGLSAETPLLFVIGGIFKDIPLGMIKQHEAMDMEHTMAVHYFKANVNGDDVVEIDVFANIYKVAGADILSTFRQIIGA